MRSMMSRIWPKATMLTAVAAAPPVADEGSLLIGEGAPPTRKFGCGFLPPKMVWICTTSRCHSSASR